MFDQPFERDLTIHVSDSAIMHLLMAGIESYHVNHWREGISEKRGPFETAGLLFGYFTSRFDMGMDIVTVEHVSTDTYAKRSSEDVTYNNKAAKVKKRIIEKRWPRLSLVGDFHTHPYKNYAELKENNELNEKAWHFSEGDYISYDVSADWRGNCALLLTVVEYKSSVEFKRVQDNVIRWQINDYHFWLSGYALDVTGSNNDEIVISPPREIKKSTQKRPNVYLDVPTINGTTTWFQY